MKESPTIREIFLAAIEIDSEEERAKYLEEACGGDATLRAEIAGLIQAHVNAGSFFRDGSEATLGETLAAGQQESDSGTQIGSYKLLQQIGEGGMGSVWMAEQEKPVRRMVALKIIKAGMDSKQVIARFEAERQALALMNHPNIAKVLDAGTTENGRPYFVMELVKGVPITEFCDKNKDAPQQRLKLFVDVCRAVQHAHQKGVIHRDIKPSNVMVTLHDGVPVVKVIDFGLAKATSQKLTERTLFTAYGQLVGTPTYMSPEQAEMGGLDVDTRTDVYSLGVLLYELMTGTTPIDARSLRKAGFAEILRIIQQEEAPPMSLRLSSLGESSTVIAGDRSSDPKRLMQFFRGDLDVIVHKSLEKDRSRRYTTPSDLADDVQRFLSHAPIEARPASAAYRLRKLYQRKKLAVTSAAIILASLVIGIVVSASQAIRATIAEGVAEERLVEVAAAQAETEIALEKESAALKKETAARRIANRSLTEMKTSFGLEADAERNNSEALLWFADAALTAEEGSQEWIESKVRLRSWRRLVDTPVNIIPQEGDLASLQLDSTGRLLATVTKTGNLRVWRLNELSEEIVYEAAGVQAARWHPLRQELVVARPDGTIEIFVGESLRSRGVVDIGEPVSCLTSTQDGRLWVAAGRTVRLFSADDLTLRSLEIDHPDTISYVELAAGGTRLLTLCNDSLVRVFRLGEEAELMLPPLRHRSSSPPNIPAAHPVFVLQGQGVITRSGSTTAAWTDVDTGELVQRITVPLPELTCITASPDGSKVAICSHRGEFQIWNTCENRLVAKIDNKRRVRSAAFAPDGLELWIVCHGQGLIRYDANDGARIGEHLYSDSNWAHLSFGPDGTQVAACGKGGLIPVWRVWGERRPTGDPIAIDREQVTDPRWRQIKLFGKSPTVKVSDSGETLLCGGSDAWGATIAEARLYSTETLEPLQKPFQANALINDVCLSRYGEIVVAATQRNELLLWNAIDSTQIGPPLPLDSEPRRIEFSRDGSVLFCLQIDGHISVFDIESRQEIRRFRHGDFDLPIYSKNGSIQGYRGANQYPENSLAGYKLGLPADNRCLVTGLIDESICLWDWRKGQFRKQPYALPSRPQDYAVSPDGTLLATAYMRSFTVSDLDDFEVKCKIEETGFVSQLDFSGDSCRIVMVLPGGRVSVWDIGGETPHQISLSRPIEGYPQAKFVDRTGRWLVIVSGNLFQCNSSVSGLPVTPSIRVNTGFATISISNKLKRAFICSQRSSIIDIISLEDLEEDDGYSASDWKRLAEALSRRQVRGSQIVELSNQDWRERIEETRTAVPEAFQGDWSKEDAIHRHRTRLERGLQADDWYAADWNLEWLRRLLGPRAAKYLNANAEAQLRRATSLARDGNIDEALQLWDVVVEILPHTENPELLELARLFAESLHDQDDHVNVRRIASRVVEPHRRSIRCFAGD